MLSTPCRRGQAPFFAACSLGVFFFGVACGAPRYLAHAAADSTKLALVPEPAAIWPAVASLLELAIARRL
jgi:hypothetical protein